ncbi:hypothetical protein GCM10018954_058370 [Kutzneria kofuensis]
MRTPSERSAAAISWVSRLRSGRCTVEGPSARAASNRARLVIDLEPGTGTVARTGSVTDGVGHGCVMGVMIPYSAARVPPWGP